MKKTLYATIALSLLFATGAVAQESTGVKHIPLFEEYTGLWCGWCPRGHVALEQLAEKMPGEYVAISYHVNDAMSVTSSFPMTIATAPAASVDRQGKIDPYYGSHEPEDMGIITDIHEAAAIEAIASIDVAGTVLGNNISATASVTFTRDIEAANYMVGYVLVSDSLSNVMWNQSNYYADYPGQLDGTPLEELTYMRSSIRGLVFNDVAVDTSMSKGVPASLPSTITAGETYKHSYLFQIEGNKLIQKLENLKIVAFVLNRVDGKIINSNVYSFARTTEDEASVGATVAETEVESREFFGLTGIKLAKPEGLCICIEKLTDGRTVSRKILAR